MTSEKQSVVKITSNNQFITVIATTGYGSDDLTKLTYSDVKVIGTGSFGVVFQAKLLTDNEIVAIKKVLQDRRFKNRELQIMRKLSHCNIVLLKYFFYSSGDKRDDVYLNLVLEYMPETLYKIGHQYSRAKQTLPINFVRLYMYQLLRSLAYIHSYGICHRDIKPQNMLIDSETGVLKLCDFGSSKQLVANEPNVSYICSRYYRAPELIFGAVNYNTKIDMWSTGCVLAELLLGQLMFPGDSGVDQIVEIVKVMGTPTSEQLHEMNRNYKDLKLPQLKSHPWPKVFRMRTPAEAVDLVSRLLVYTPNSRISPMMGCAHPFFDELRQDPNQTLPNGRPLPPLFNFTDYELKIESNLEPLLQPKNEHTTRNTAGTDVSTNQSKAGSTHKLTTTPVVKSKQNTKQLRTPRRQVERTERQTDHVGTHGRVESLRSRLSHERTKRPQQASHVHRARVNKLSMPTSVNAQEIGDGDGGGISAISVANQIQHNYGFNDDNDESVADMNYIVEGNDNCAGACVGIEDTYDEDVNISQDLGIVVHDYDYDGSAEDTDDADEVNNSENTYDLNGIDVDDDIQENICSSGSSVHHKII